LYLAPAHIWIATDAEPPARLLLALTTPTGVATQSNVSPVPLLRQRVVVRGSTFEEIVIWRVPGPVLGSLHPYKYRMALIEAGACVVRYDNEAGKGDHRHIGDREEPYAFTTIERLLDDFEASVRSYLDGHPDYR
jgi:hypothetical protein